MRRVTRRYFMSIIILSMIAFIIFKDELPDMIFDNDLEDWNNSKRKYYKAIEESIRSERGTGCDIPLYDPNAEELIQYDFKAPEGIVCEGHDWVNCHFSKCKVTPEILSNMTEVECTYRDMQFKGDDVYSWYGRPEMVRGSDEYTLVASDNVRIYCGGKSLDGSYKTWNGWKKGYRLFYRNYSERKDDDSPNIILIAIDSLSRAKMMRILPKSYKFIKEELNATILNKYNVVGDGTAMNMVPLLTGRHMFELMDCRVGVTETHVDEWPFIFYKLREAGFRTAYYEDSPWVGTFTFKYNGFKHQPTDHYLSDFYKDYYRVQSHFDNHLCMGDRPQFKFMLNLIDQFTQLDGKKFLFSLIVDVANDPLHVHRLNNLDKPLEALLRAMVQRQNHKDTLIAIFGDHGPRYGNGRNTYYGKLEERLPLMAIRLPDNLIQKRPEVLTALKYNVDSLVTPYDIHATLLDYAGIQFTRISQSFYELPRGISLFTQIPANRSCHEAGVTPYWCACAPWVVVPRAHYMHQRTAHALLAHINALTLPLRSKCAERTLLSIQWVKMRNLTSLGFDVPQPQHMYTLSVTLGPGKAEFEASVTHLLNVDKILVDTSEISRISWYGHEADCVKLTYPHLNYFCYCI